jgi:membrane protein YdbS with pleckstrin-like domain
MRWNIVIGVSVAVLALVQLAITALGYFDPDRHFVGYGDMLFTAVAAIAFLLIYPLLRGQNWARLSLIVLLAVCALGVGLLVPFSFIANHWIYTRLPISFSGLFTIAVIVIFIVVLLHPDVRRDFTALPRQTV